MISPIAIVGMACRYPDAQSPGQLWENVLAQRRAFRRIPPERLRLEDYLNSDRTAPDSIYSSEAALIDGYEFDRIRFHVTGAAFRSSDLVHWLALDIASQALTDAGFSSDTDLPHDSTGVLVGNTLTGEFSRANMMRLRWPYVRRVVEAALSEEGWSQEQCRAFLDRLETTYKKPFAPVGEETLAGGLSNTIAGRICNHFNLKGGGYTVDGACASSLLAVSTACSALAGHDIDVALAGGVDLSMDPFELVGFAKATALAAEEMRVYDAHSAGFWPGEGCGFVVLMRYEDAVLQCRRIYAVIRGWGISSDGNGGITRPEVEGQQLALSRAYRRADFDIGTVFYFEGHGTGTSVGDTTELLALSHARKRVAPHAPPALIGSIKANIGHTKAAAGIAGLIKATMAISTQVLPPTTGCREPHQVLKDEIPALQVTNEGKLWPTDLPLRAGISAMGFGGINAHIVLEGIINERRKTLSSKESRLLSSTQDAELLLLQAQDSLDLQQQVERLLAFAPRLSHAEVADLANHLEKTLSGGSVRAAIVASSPMDLTQKLETLKTWLQDGLLTKLDLQSGVFLGEGAVAPRIGFLFPGQGSPAHLNGGAWRQRFEFVRELYAWAGLPIASDSIATEIAQPAIVTASMAALQALHKFGITAHIAVGHSLGEITALHWAGVLDANALLRVATVRGKAMSELGSPTGMMASIMADRREVEGLLNGEQVVIAGLNSPYQTVISGEAVGVSGVVTRAQARGLKSVTLPVSHAFHSPLVEMAVKPLAEHLLRETFQPLQHIVISTVTGMPLSPNEDFRNLLCQQVIMPVRFTEAISIAAEQVDFLIEVGPGRVLSGLISEFIRIPVIPLDTGGNSLKGLLQVGGAAFALGTPINHSALFADRFTRPFHLDWSPRFFVNPCELAPVSGPVRSSRNIEAQVLEDTEATIDCSPLPVTALSLDLVRQLVAERAELPLSAITDDSRLLNDLHLNSITVGQLVTEAARSLGLPPLVAPTDYANATIAEITRALEELAHTGATIDTHEHNRPPAGVDVWIRPFTVEFLERPLPRRQHALLGAGSWQVVAPQDDPLLGLLQQTFNQSNLGKGVIVCLPPEPDERHIAILLEGAHIVLSEKDACYFVLVQHGGGGAAFARTLYLEAPTITTCVIDVPPGHPQTVEWILAEVRAAIGYSEAIYDESGRRWEPVLQSLSLPDEITAQPPGSEDVLLVTGGGKGIAAECAFYLARTTGVRLALVGRSQPISDTELAVNLDRMTKAGIHFCYVTADVTDAEAVRTAVQEVEANLGPVTALLHAAGANVPALLASLDEKAILHTLAPKVYGLRNVLAAIDPAKLRLLITFGSVIARTGMRGEADYALANDWLARLTESFQAKHPSCRCLVIEWSIWSGIGMGERLGRVDSLIREGITPISPDEGVSIFSHLVVQPLPAVRVVVTSRFGETPTLKMEQPELPLLRFLEQTKVYYPGVELISDIELSIATDPYVDDHKLQGERLFPAVMGLEAMAQSAMALTGFTHPPIFENVQFNRPIVVPEEGSLKIRVAALMRETAIVEVVVRSEETAFQTDHFRAVCHFYRQNSETITRRLPSIDFGTKGERALAIDPLQDLYGGILFHRGRFQRLHNYRRLRATECLAEIAPGKGENWFGRYLPAELILGDPAARDAVIHAIQACIPHMTLLPTGVDQWIPCFEVAQACVPQFVYAKERRRDGDLFIYDVEVIGSDGCLLELWVGLKLRSVSKTEMRGAWPEPLLGPYIERRIGELMPGASVAVEVQRVANFERRSRSNKALEQILGTKAVIHRRPDGKPVLEDSSEASLSVSHADDLTLVITSHRPVGCDVESVQARPLPIWQDLLGPERYKLAMVITHNGGGNQNTAATRVWSSGECLKKAGAMVEAPLIFNAVEEDGWVMLTAGSFVVATYVATVQGTKNQLAFAFALKSNNEYR